MAILQDSNKQVSPDALFQYAIGHARRAEAAGRGTQFPTFRKAAQRFRTTLDAIEDAVQDYHGPGYMGMVVGIAGNGAYGSFNSRGDYQVEAYDDE